ncbi:hypothetical protein L1887_15638 [Cichorium endivia]|nr:hypothetical protein L1887_15638 [Cichorium endivia]
MRLCILKRNLQVDANVDSVWNALPDYERLADFIPNHIFSARIPCVHPGRIWLEQEFPVQEFHMLSAQTTYSCSISEVSCEKRKQIRSEAAD